MFFKQLFDPSSSTYTYLIADDETHEAVLIDSVIEQLERDLKLIREHDLTLKYVLDCIGNLNHLFSARSYIAELASVSIVGEFRESFVKIPVLLRSAWAAQRSDGREVFQMTPLART